MIKLLKNHTFWLGVILIIAFLIRLYKIDNPIADWHAWRQADTAAVARIFYQEGYNPLLTRYQDMSGVAEKPIPNPQRYRFVEFPIYNSLIYLAFLANGAVNESLARLISVTFSLGSIIFLYLISKRFLGFGVAILSSLLFAILPYNVYFSRVILPEPALVFFCLGMFYFVERWITKETLGLYLASLFFTIGAFLIKPVAIFYLLPLIYSYYKKEGRFWPVPARYFLWLIPSALPLIAWRVWISQFPEGIPASNWLFNGNGIRFKPAFWRWIINERFGKEILSVAGTLLFFIGLLKKPQLKEGLLMHLLALSSFLYLIVLATGNVQHDYYQMLIVPPLVIFSARGFFALWSGFSDFVPRFWTIIMALLFLPLMIYFGWIEVKGLYQVNNGVIVEAGRRADQILPKKAVVVAPYSGDTSFLYYTNRPGWPVVAYPIQELIDKFSVTHYVSVNYDAKTKWLLKKYKIIEANPRYIILDLTEKNPLYMEEFLSKEELIEPM